MSHQRSALSIGSLIPYVWVEPFLPLSNKLEPLSPPPVIQDKTGSLRNRRMPLDEVSCQFRSSKKGFNLFRSVNGMTRESTNKRINLRSQSFALANNPEAQNSLRFRTFNTSSFKLRAQQKRYVPALCFILRWINFALDRPLHTLGKSKSRCCKWSPSSHRRHRSHSPFWTGWPSP